MGFHPRVVLMSLSIHTAQTLLPFFEIGQGEHGVRASSFVDVFNCICEELCMQAGVVKVRSGSFK